MKLLLTSGGITNKKIANALIDLVGKPAKEIKIAFIPTAINIDPGDKSWFVDDLYEIRQQNYKNLDIVDVSALPKKIWLPRLEAADVLFFSGGNSPHLMRWVEKSGLKKILPKLLKTRVYASISAGSVITAPTLAVSNKEKVLSYKKKFGYKADKGLGFVNFFFRSHFNSPQFPHTTKKKLEKISKQIKKKIYALDDHSALKVVDEEVEIVGQGKYFVFNK